MSEAIQRTTKSVSGVLYSGVLLYHFSIPYLLYHSYITIFWRHVDKTAFEAVHFQLESDGLEDVVVYTSLYLVKPLLYHEKRFAHFDRLVDFFLHFLMSQRFVVLLDHQSPKEADGQTAGTAAGI